MSERVSTYTWNNVLGIAGRKMSKTLVDDYGSYIANLTLSRIWEMYDWRQSLTILPSFYLVPNEQDFGAPTVAIPPDFAGIRWANLVRTDNTPPYRQPLIVIKDLQPTHIRYLPHSIGYVSEKRALRIFPRFPDNLGSPTYLIEGQYKNRPAKITTANLSNTVLPFDDMYVEAFVETAKWIAWQLDSDPRAGEITWANGEFGANGQAAIALQLIDWMAGREGLELGEPTIAPFEPLVTQGPYRPALFGLGFSF